MRQGDRPGLGAAWVVTLPWPERGYAVADRDGTTVARIAWKPGEAIGALEAAHALRAALEAGGARRERALRGDARRVEE